MRGFSVATFGVRVGFEAPDAELEEALASHLLLPGWEREPHQPSSLTFSLARVGDGFQASRDGEVVSAPETTLEGALADIDRLLHIGIGAMAHEYVFVHAGVITWQGQALMLPARSWDGKSTLVHALVRAGATFYSDEVAPLDARGRVHCYPRPLKLRGPAGDSRLPLGDERLPPCPVAAVLLTRYEAGARFDPQPITAGRCVLGVLTHTVPARLRPQEVLETLGRVCSAAAGWEGPRGEADEAAAAILRTLLA